MASDGDGDNGVFTRNFIDKMKIEGLDIRIMIGKVAEAVEKDTNNSQTPYMEGMLKGEFSFKIAQTGASMVLNYSSDAEKDAWDIVKSSTDSAVIKDFLEKFPNGPYSNTAKIKLRQLENMSSGSSAIRVNHQIANFSDLIHSNSMWQVVSVAKSEDSIDDFTNENLLLQFDNGAAKLFSGRDSISIIFDKLKSDLYTAVYNLYGSRDNEIKCVINTELDTIECNGNKKSKGTLFIEKI